MNVLKDTYCIKLTKWHLWKLNYDLLDMVEYILLYTCVVPLCTLDKICITYKKNYISKQIALFDSNKASGNRKTCRDYIARLLTMWCT